MILITCVLSILIVAEAGNMSKCNPSNGLCITHRTAFVSSISKTRRSQLWMTEKPDPPSIKPPPLDDNILKGEDVETMPLFDVSTSVDQEAVKNFGVNLSKTYVAPIFSGEVVRGVPQDIFKGALVSGAGLSALAGKGILFAGATGLGIAYVATTPGPIGDSARVVGKVTWTSTQNLLHLNEKYELSRKFVTYLKEILPKVSSAFGDSKRLEIVMEKIRNVNLLEESNPKPLEIDDEVTRLVKEAEDTVATVQIMLDEQKLEVNGGGYELEPKLDVDASVDAENDIGNKPDTISELGEIIAGGSNDTFNETELPIEDLSDSISTESDVAEILNSDISIDKETNIQDELNDIPELSGDELEPKLDDDALVDAEKELNASSGLEKSIVNESEDISSEPEASMEELGKAARAAVEQYEREQKLNAASELEKSIVDESDDTSNESEASMEELGKAARAAVDQYESEERERVIAAEVIQDYNNLTVVKLKDILRSRGLKVTGRKADLIIRLKENE